MNNNNNKFHHDINFYQVNFRAVGTKDLKTKDQNILDLELKDLIGQKSKRQKTSWGKKLLKGHMT